MQLIFKSNDFEHIDYASYYNHNHYQYIGRDANYPFEILEICHEDDNFCEYYLIKEKTQTFLGCSSDYIHPDSMVVIDFQLYYT